MIMVPPRHYCIILNPVERTEDGEVVYENDNGQVRLRHGDEEIRFQSDPFPLYPGEKLFGNVTPLKIVSPNTALHLLAVRDYTDGEVVRKAGDEWLFKGPGTYLPRVEEKIVNEIKAIIVKPNEALLLRAKKEFEGADGIVRMAGEEWLHRQSGSYIPDVNESVEQIVQAVVLTEKKALHLQAIRTFTDVFGVKRKAGEEWLVTIKESETHIPDVHEKVIGEVKLISLSSRQYCVVVDPFVDGKNLLGKKELRKGETAFFLLPGESLEDGIQNVHVLDSEEALLLRAKEAFDDVEGGKSVKRAPGDRWMINGPTDYVPPVAVQILERRSAIPLDENEGIYVRDITTGKVRAITGETYMLKPDEELWKKELPDAVETLLASELSRDRKSQGVSNVPLRDKTRVATYRIPHNSAVQVYDYKSKKPRVVFGPDLVMLGPDEQFTVLSLSGNVPKTPHVIKTLALLLGPDFMTDLVIVETSDHARLSLKVSYNWHFEVDKDDPVDREKPFQVPDFVGTCCKAIASRIRGAVATQGFDSFHKNSTDIIRLAIFGKDESGEIGTYYKFSDNNLVISGIDIQSVEPVDQRTRDALQKSVQLAIEITTKSQEATARHEAERQEQEARGRLERQKITDEAQAEKAKKELLQLQAQSAAVESTGQATAEAKARAEASIIEGESSVQQAKLLAEAENIKSNAELERLKQKQQAEIEHMRLLNELEVKKSKELVDIETKKFADIVKAIGPETIKAIAQAGPEMQAKLLQGLGLKGYLITDGSSPVNLFNTAQGLIGGSPTLGKQSSGKTTKLDVESDDEF